MGVQDIISRRGSGGSISHRSILGPGPGRSAAEVAEVVGLAASLPVAGAARVVLVVLLGGGLLPPGPWPAPWSSICC